MLPITVQKLFVLSHDSNCTFAGEPSYFTSHTSVLSATAALARTARIATNSLTMLCSKSEDKHLF